MPHRLLITLATPTFTLAPLAALDAPRKARKAPVRLADPARSYAPPRTPDGQPDISGTWSNATHTPLERPTELKDKAFFTPEEAAAYAQRRLDGLYAQAKDNLHYDDAIWQSEKTPKGVNGLR